jgi:hypothetical protein
MAEVVLEIIILIFKAVQVFCPVCSREWYSAPVVSGKVFALRQAVGICLNVSMPPYLSNSWNLQAISLSPLGGGEGRVRGVM